MTAPSSIAARFLAEQLQSASPGLLRSLLTTFINTLMSAEADAVCGAASGTSSSDRVRVRNGYRPREFDTRAGTLEVAIPRLRTGSYFPGLYATKRGQRPRIQLVPGLGHHRLDRLQPEHVEKLLDQGAAPASVLQTHRVLSRALQLAMQRGKVARNNCKLVDARRVERVEVQPLTGGEA